MVGIKQALKEFKVFWFTSVRKSNGKLITRFSRQYARDLTWHWRTDVKILCIGKAMSIISALNINLPPSVSCHCFLSVCKMLRQKKLNYGNMYLLSNVWIDEATKKIKLHLPSSIMMHFYNCFGKDRKVLF